MIAIDLDANHGLLYAYTHIYSILYMSTALRLPYRPKLLWRRLPFSLSMVCPPGPPLQLLHPLPGIIAVP